MLHFIASVCFQTLADKLVFQKCTVKFIPVHMEENTAVQVFPVMPVFLSPFLQMSDSVTESSRLTVYIKNQTSSLRIIIEIHRFPDHIHCFIIPLHSSEYIGKMLEIGGVVSFSSLHDLNGLTGILQCLLQPVLHRIYIAQPVITVYGIRFFFLQEYKLFLCLFKLQHVKIRHAGIEMTGG